MPFKYSCFISYSKNRSDFVQKVIEQLKETLESYIYLHSVNKEVYIDQERLGPGCHYNEELSCAICQSICMIVVYTPSYKHRDHLYCQREYTAMEQIENERIKMLGGRFKNKGMIIPIILRGEKEEIPSKITDHIQYCDFSMLTTASPHIKRIRKCVDEIEKIAITVSDYYRIFNDRNINPCSGCDSFRLPSEKDVNPWEARSDQPITPFFGREV